MIRGNTVTNNLGNGIHFDVNSIGPLIDGNTVESNVDPDSAGGTGIVFEISNGGATIRNNYVQFNGIHGAYGIQSSTSQGAVAYCNVVEEMANTTNMLWTINTADRGDITTAPNAGTYQTSAGNYFHHNTFIWDAGLQERSALCKTTQRTSLAFSQTTHRPTITRTTCQTRARLRSGSGLFSASSPQEGSPSLPER